MNEISLKMIAYFSNPEKLKQFLEWIVDSQKSFEMKNLDIQVSFSIYKEYIEEHKSKRAAKKILEALKKAHK